MSRDADAVRLDLESRVEGDLLFDALDRVHYSTAACIFEMTPLGVVAPAHADDVAAVVKYCGETGIPLTARGAGTGVAGQSVGEGLILDFRRRMNRILDIDPKRRIARVEPGVVLAKLNAEAARHGLMFAPDPSSGRVCTVGGMIANNASGIHGPAYGATRDHVKSLGLVFDSAHTGVQRRERIADIRHKLRTLLEASKDVLAAARPDTLKNSSGYLVFDVKPDDPNILDKITCGSEGTLAVVTEATLALVPVPEKRVLARLVFRDMASACAAVPALRDIGVAALELVDDTVLGLMRKHPDYAALVPRDAQVLLLAEFSATDAVARAHAIPDLVAFDAGDPKLWLARKAISPLLERLPGPERSTRLIEDVAVDPSCLLDFVNALHGVLDPHGLRAAVFGHAGGGHLHVNVLMNPHDPRTPGLMEEICVQIARRVRQLGGTLSGEHGDGLLRAPYLRGMFGPAYDVFADIKRLFDPRGLLNPGKIVAADDFRFTRRLRGTHRPGLRGDPAHERCNGCGFCIDYCPMQADGLREAFLPRAFANTLVAMNVDPARVPDGPHAQLTARFADRCPACNRCLTSCPAAFNPVPIVQPR